MKPWLSSLSPLNLHFLPCKTGAIIFFPYSDDLYGPERGAQREWSLVKCWWINTRKLRTRALLCFQNHQKLTRLELQLDASRCHHLPTQGLAQTSNAEYGKLIFSQEEAHLFLNVTYSLARGILMMTVLPLTFWKMRFHTSDNSVLKESSTHAFLQSKEIYNLMGVGQQELEIVQKMSGENVLGS